MKESCTSNRCFIGDSFSLSKDPYFLNPTANIPKKIRTILTKLSLSSKKFKKV